MITLDIDECLNLYFLLCSRDDLSENLNRLLIKIEAELFSRYTVYELENLRLEFNNKG